MGMRCSYYCHSFSHRYINLIFFFSLVSTSTQLRFMDEGRAINKLVEVAKMGNAEKMHLKAQIGSRPPRCEMRCGSCGHCEAVQVPAVPQYKNGGKHTEVAASLNGEDTSNYKPMSWKCKCGDMIFNP